MNDKHEPQRKTVGLRPFKKNDPRINRSGRPRSFDEFRRLAQMIAREKVLGADGNWISRAEAMLRRWEKSRNPQLQRLFMEYAFGKVPDKLETDTLENRTVLRLYYAHERPEVEAAERAELERGNYEKKALTLQPPDNGSSRRLRGP